MFVVYFMLNIESPVYEICYWDSKFHLESCSASIILLQWLGVSKGCEDSDVNLSEKEYKGKNTGCKFWRALHWYSELFNAL